MTKVAELQKIGFVKLGFDRAGTSTARKKDGHLFEEAGTLKDAGQHEEAVSLLKSTDWWYGYQTSVKQAVKLEAQSFDGELEIMCIKGGFITQVEAAEMDRILTEATADCLKSSIDVRYRITEVSYYDFLSAYEPICSDGAEASNGRSSSIELPQCDLCCGRHQHALRSAGCSAEDCSAYCRRITPRSQYPLLHIGSKLNCSAEGPCTKDDGTDGNGRDYPYALTQEDAEALGGFSLLHFSPKAVRTVELVHAVAKAPIVKYTETKPVCASRPQHVPVVHEDSKLHKCKVVSFVE
jgi:hypothetical protein